MILDLMIHDIDLVLSLIDSEVEKIDVAGIPVLSGSEDIVNARIKFVNGSCANLTASRVSATPMRRVRVFRENSFASMDFGNITGSTVTRRDQSGLVTEEVTLESKNALAAELDDFINAIRLSRKSGEVQKTLVSGRQGLKALELACAIENEARRYNEEYGFKFPLWSPDAMA